MTSNRTELQRQEAAIERELERRKRPLSATEAQIMAARGHDGRPHDPEVEEDRTKWSATELQAFAARGIKPPRRYDNEGDD